MRSQPKALPHMTYWYAVKKHPDDQTNKGSSNFAEAMKMLSAQGSGEVAKINLDTNTVESVYPMYPDRY